MVLKWLRDLKIYRQSVLSLEILTVDLFDFSKHLQATEGLQYFHIFMMNYGCSSAISEEKG